MTYFCCWLVVTSIKKNAVSARKTRVQMWNASALLRSESTLAIAVFSSVFFFLFVAKNTRSNRLNKKLSEWEESEWERIRPPRRAFTEIVHALVRMREPWRKTAAAEKVREITLFRCHFHGNWTPREGPSGSPVAFRHLDSRRAIKYEKDEERVYVWIIISLFSQFLSLSLAKSKRGEMGEMKKLTDRSIFIILKKIRANYTIHKKKLRVHADIYIYVYD